MAFFSASTSAAPLQCTQAEPARHLTPDAAASIASSGTVRKTMSARSATSCGAQARAPRTRFASFCAEAIFRLAIATTDTPARAKPVASPVPTRPAPMKPSVNFFGAICYELYEGARDVACGRQTILGHRVNAGGTLAFIGYVSADMDINS